MLFKHKNCQYSPKWLEMWYKTANTVLEFNSFAIGHAGLHPDFKIEVCYV